MKTCGIMHGRGVGIPEDIEGCCLPLGHASAHEYVAADGRSYQWETDWECTCEDCMTGDGDYCTTYWPKARVFAFCRSMPGEPTMRAQLEAIQAATGSDIEAGCVIEDGAPALAPPSKRPALRLLLATAGRGDRVIVAASRLLGLTRADVRAVVRQIADTGARVSSLDDGDLNSLRPTGNFKETL